MPQRRRSADADDDKATHEMIRLKSLLALTTKKKDDEIGHLQLEVRHLQRTKDALEQFCNSLWREISLLKKLLKKRHSVYENVTQTLEAKEKIMWELASNDDKQDPEEDIIPVTF